MRVEGLFITRGCCMAIAAIADAPVCVRVGWTKFVRADGHTWLVRGVERRAQEEDLIAVGERFAILLGEADVVGPGDEFTLVNDEE